MVLKIRSLEREYFIVRSGFNSIFFFLFRLLLHKLFMLEIRTNMVLNVFKLWIYKDGVRNVGLGCV